MKTRFNKIRFKVHQLRQRFKQGEVTRWQKIKYFIFALFGVFVTFSLVLFLWIWATLPDINDHEKIFAAQSSVILDRNGALLYKIKGDEDREIVPYTEISKYAPLAAISIEDDQFYNHGGFDFAAILKAVCSQVGVCSQARGGSTITQQYIKNAFLTNERTYSRKIKEIILSMQLENRYSKDEILALYLNRIPYGSIIYGVEVASQKFFGKSASKLTIAESAILASLPKSPTYYWPYGENAYARINLDEKTILEKDLRNEQDIIDASEGINLSKGLLGKTYTFGEGDQKRDIYVKGRVEFVLDRMYELGHITEEERNKAQKEADNMVFKPLENSLDKAPHFVTDVKELLEEKYGVDKVNKGGLKITTTLNYEMQKMAEEAIASRAEVNQNKYGANNASLISLDPNNGQILAMVGSRDFNDAEIEGQNNLTTSRRQPGSSFKPFVYAAAFLKGHAPSTVVYDVKTTFNSDGSKYTPDNYSGKFNGPVSMRNALGGSLNIPAIKAGYLASMDNVMKLAAGMGMYFVPQDYYGLASALGTNEIAPLDMARGYSVFANGGYRVEPIYILKVEDAEGNILEEYEAPKDRKQALDPQVAYLVNDILTDKNARPADFWRNGITLSNQLNGAKTGTSNIEAKSGNHSDILPRDNWTIGYVRNLVTAVWVGNTKSTALKPGADGLTTAAPIWKEYMTKASEKVEKGEFEKPEGLKWVNISKRSGKLASKKTPSGDIIKAVFASFGVPKDYDSSYQVVKIDKVSGKLATEFTPEDAIEEKVFYTAHDVLPEWDAAAQAWARAAGMAGGAPPTEYDDVHTAETMNAKPQISITSPSSSGIVSPPRVAVMVDITSPAGVQRVDYYLDDELLTTVSNSPFHGSLPLSADFADGSIHSIKAIVYDELLHSNQSSITVKIGADDTPPTVSFAFPKNNAKLTAGSSVGIQLQAYDGNGAVVSAKYYLDGKLYQNDIEPPFEWQLTVPTDEGSYELMVEAFDQAKNKSSDSIQIQVVAQAEKSQGGGRGNTHY